MTELTVVLIYRDDEDNAEKCMKSVSDIADKVFILVSCNWTEKVERFCRVHNHPFLRQDAYTDTSRLLQGLSETIAAELLFVIYSNEYISSGLRNSISSVKEQNTHDGYNVNRMFNYYGKWMRHSGISPDQPVRLFYREAACWTETTDGIMLKLKDQASAELLNGDIYCISYRTINHHLRQVNHATEIQALESYKKGTRGGYLKICFFPLFRFIRVYFLNLGFLDGLYGFIYSIIAGYSVFLFFVKLKDYYRSR